MVGLGLVAGAGLAVVHGGLFEARYRTVVGARHTPAAAIWEAAGIESSTPLIDISPATAAAGVERLPWVVHAAVRLHWPDAVTIAVTEGTPVAAVRRGADELVVDAAGKVLGPLSSATGAASLPLLVAPGAVPRPGGELGPLSRPGLAVAAALPPTLRTSVQAVRVSNAGQVDLVLGGSITAELGTATELRAELESLVAVLSNAQSAPAGAAVVDVEDPLEPTVAPGASIAAAQQGHA